MRHLAVRTRRVGSSRGAASVHAASRLSTLSSSSVVAAPPRSSRLASASAAWSRGILFGSARTRSAAVAASSPATARGNARPSGVPSTAHALACRPRTANLHRSAAPLPQPRRRPPQAQPQVLQRALVLHTPTPAVDPLGPVRVIIPRSTEIEEAEGVLQRAMVATITGTRPAVAIDEVARVLCSLGLEAHDFSIHRHHPEDFLIIFTAKHFMTRVAGDHFIGNLNFTLTIRPWCKLAHAGIGRLDYHVDIEISGIPPHAWNLSSAEFLLGGAVWVERLHPGTRSRADMATFRLSGRAGNPTTIRQQAILEIAELVPAGHPSLPPTLRTLTYPCSISVVHSELDEAAAAVAANLPDGSGGAQGRGTGPDDHGRGAPGRRRGRGRKRRRPNDAGPQAGRADGLAVDSLTWATMSRGGRADGLACDARWSDARLDAPPAPPPGGAAPSVRSMAPWPNPRGARRRRRNRQRRPRQTRCFWRVKEKQPVSTPAPPGDAVAAPTSGQDPRPIETPSLTAGETPLASVSNFSSSGPPSPALSPASGEKRGAPTHDADDHRLCRDREPSDNCSFEGSEVPDSQMDAAPPTKDDRLSGLRGASPAPNLVPVLEDSVDQESPPLVASGNDHASPALVDDASAPSFDRSPAQAPGAALENEELAPAHGQDLACEEGEITPRPAPREATTPSKFSATPKVYMRRSQQRAHVQSKTWTLGEFLAAVTSHLRASLPTPGKRPRTRSLNFSPRREEARRRAANC
uniref:Uncharacterized protein n=1 Tax=Avena sativa TaxID=4498 RepID=A0ACD5ZF05_AVESA